MHITFDFDHTLCILPREAQTGDLDWGPKISIPFGEIVEQFKSLQEQGHTVSILTTRMDENMATVHDFVTEQGLKPANIWNTNFEWKATFLNKLLVQGIKIDQHWDDNMTEFSEIKANETLDHVDFKLVLPPSFHLGTEVLQIIDPRNPTPDQQKLMWMLIRG
jgi:hypothetical protein